MPGDDPLIVPVGTPGEESMATPLEMLHEQNMAQLGQSGVVAQNNFITVEKASDYDFLVTKNQVTLSQALGAREVGSRVTPAGPSPASP